LIERKKEITDIPYFKSKLDTGGKSAIEIEDCIDNIQILYKWKNCGRRSEEEKEKGKANPGSSKMMKSWIEQR